MSNFKILKGSYIQKRDLDTVVAIVDGEKTATLNDMYRQLTKQLKLPSYFGKNLDALYDCLCDFSWLDAREIHIVLRGYDNFLNNEQPLKRWDVLNVLNDTANEWKAMKGKDKIKFEIYIEPSQRIKKDLEDAEI
jgi:RNAse (barnase) inhibitor barstar